MTATTLTKTQTALLIDAGSRPGGLLVLQGTVKGAAAKQLFRKLLDTGLVAADDAGGPAYSLTPASYEAIGVKPPRPAQVAADAARTEVAPPSGSKRHRVLEMLQRTEGASLDELTAATGWLPHTTRAVLSRLRSAGHPLTRQEHDDGRSAYRIIRNEPKGTLPPREARASEAA